MTGKHFVTRKQASQSRWETCFPVTIPPSTSFSQAPWYTLPVHLCRFRVRSVRWSYFLDLLHCTLNPIRGYNTRRPSLPAGPRILTWFPVTIMLQPRLRNRLTLRRLTLRRNPWSFGVGVFHTHCRYSCQHSHF